VDRFGAAQFQQVAGELLLRMQAAVSDENSLRSAAPLAIGTTNSIAAANGLYRMTAGPGQKLDIELRMAHSRAAFKPVLSMFGSDGKLFQTCENPGDDDIEPPGVPDPTPEEFDDLCMNNISGKGGSEIEILVPAASRTPVELYVRVSDWDGRPLPADYQIVVNSPSASH
jgi:hypothetical protein